VSKLSAVRAAERAVNVEPGEDPVKEMAIALNGGYGANKRNQAWHDLREMLTYLAAQPSSAPEGFDAA